MNLYLKYRPKLIEELDLDSVRQTLTSVIASNSVAHAYLMTGPRGAGKTSAARILARIVNCEKNAKKLGEPCNTCSACVSILSGSAVDVIEIDAASNRGIDDIRELKEKIRLSPAILRKKVYIIDEVHMLTTEAFNALLKTLEEPPLHAMFILCTTESHKVPETIVSRCVRIAFAKATTAEMMRSVERVVKGEAGSIPQSALLEIVEAVDGSFRDGVKIIDTILSKGGTVTLADVQVILHGASGYTSDALATALVAKDLAGALALFQTSMGEGVDLVFLLVSLMKELRNRVLAGCGIAGLGDEVAPPTIAQLIYTLDDVARKIATSPAPTILVEMTIIEWCTTKSLDVETEHVEKPSTPLSESPRKVAKTVKAVAATFADEVVVKTEVITATYEDVGSVAPGDMWKTLIASMNGDSYSLGTLLSQARPGVIRGDLLTIEFGYEFHQQQLMNEKFRSRVEKIVSDVVGRPMRIEGIVNPSMNSLQTKGEVGTIAEVLPEENEMMEAAEEIFGS